MALHRAGNLQDAQAGYAQILRAQPMHADALAMMGLLAHQVGEHRKATEFLRKALNIEPEHRDAALHLGIALRADGDIDAAIAQFRAVAASHPDYAAGHCNLGLALHEAGSSDDATAHFEQALTLDGRFADAHNGLGLALQQQGQADTAMSHYRRAIAIDPTYVEAYNNLGSALRSDGRLAEALEQFETAARLGRNDPEAQRNLGTALRALGRSHDAVAPLRRLVSLDPKSAPAHVELGVALQEQGSPMDALACYRAAIALDPQHAGAHRNMAVAFLDLGQHHEAQAAFHRVFDIEHGGGWWNAPTFAEGARASAAAPRETAGSRSAVFKLEDTVDQLEYLIRAGMLDPSYREMIAHYQFVLATLGDAGDETGGVPLTAEQLERIGSFYNRVIRFKDTERIGEGAINPDLDYEAICDSYLSSPVSLTTLDDFLTPQALAALRRFCLESTTFFKYSGARFVGTDVSGGFNCSLLYQIAEELKAAMPRVLGHLNLTNIWAYRHANDGEGVEAHTDEGAVTFNFWITPDDANLEPKRGGLIVYAKEQPYDWDWHTFNVHKNRPDIRKKIYDFLNSAETLTVPYRANRALLFHSNLFHRSDRIRFRPGYENRRINVTMLFGRRHDLSPA